MQNKYISIRKINLSRKTHAMLEQEYDARLRSPSTQVFDFHLGEYPVFVVLTPRLLAMIVRIHKDSARLTELQQYALPDICRQWYVTRILVDEIKLTNDMENVHSTRKEVKDAVESVERADRPHNVRFYGMAAKYSSLLRNKQDALNTCADVRKLYDDFMAREVVAEHAQDALDGQIFRKEPVYVQDSHGKRIHDGSWPEPVIIENMERALAILNDGEVDRLIRVAVFHYLFGYIHPFYNGNGRLSRFISSMMLSDELNTLAGLRLSYVIKDHKRQYDNLFKEANDLRGRGDLTDFVEAFCGYVNIALRDMIDNLEEGSEVIRDMQAFIDATKEFKGYERVIEILGLNGLFAEDALSITDLMQHAECGRAKVQKGLNAAREMGLLTSTKDGHKYLYTIEPSAWLDLLKRSST